MIEVSNLKFRYAESEKFAIDGITLKIPRGKYVAIVGHNGSGKSTFSKLLVGLYKALEGTIKVDNVEMSRKTLTQIRKKIGIVFQNPDNQFIGSSVEDDIAFGLENKKLSRQEMKSIVLKNSKKVGMDKFLEREPSHLSGGQKQRVAIASILALDPEIIIFDEITSMLDPKGKKEVIKIIDDIKRDKNKTLVSITHDMDEAILADEILVFSNGQLVANGNPKDILNNKKITNLAKIDAPFIYKVSSKLVHVKNTYSKKELIKSLCK